MNKFIEFGKRLGRDEEGATAIEYGLLAALIAVGIIALVGTLGDTIAGAFDEINDEMAAEGSFAVD
jgi:pilus assembly protein Flp/PilA